LIEDKYGINLVNNIYKLEYKILRYNRIEYKYNGNFYHEEEIK
jgi:hypothetical protein